MKSFVDKGSKQEVTTVVRLIKMAEKKPKKTHAVGAIVRQFISIDLLFPYFRVVMKLMLHFTFPFFLSALRKKAMHYESI